MKKTTQAAYKPKRGRNVNYWLVEKKNHLALHGIFHSLESAENHLKETIPVYVARRYFTDKTLTADSFEVIPAKNRPNTRAKGR